MADVMISPLLLLIIAEMNSTRELSSSAGNTLAAFIPGMLSNDANKSTNGTHSSANNEQAKQNGKKSASVSSEVGNISAYNFKILITKNIHLQRHG